MSSPKKVGIFVVATLALIAGMILNFSKGSSYFTPAITVRVLTERVGGLKVGAPVAVSGVPVGHVTAIDLSEDRREVEIRLRIERRYPVHGDARFGIEQSGFLGDEFVSIVPRRNEKPVLGDGAIVRAETPFNLQEAARSATQLLGKLDTAIDRINDAVGRVDEKLLGDSTLTHLAQTAANVRLASAEAAAALADIRLVVSNNAPVVGQALTNLGRLTVRLDSLATNVDQFITEQRPAVSNAIANAGVVTEDLRGITSDLRAGRGVAGGLLSDEALRLQLGSALTNLATTSSNLANFGILYKPPRPRKTLTNPMRFPSK